MKNALILFLLIIGVFYATAQDYELEAMEDAEDEITALLFGKTWETVSVTTTDGEVISDVSVLKNAKQYRTYTFNEDGTMTSTNDPWGKFNSWMFTDGPEMEVGTDTGLAYAFLQEYTATEITLQLDHFDLGETVTLTLRPKK